MGEWCNGYSYGRLSKCGSTGNEWSSDLEYGDIKCFSHPSHGEVGFDARPVQPDPGFQNLGPSPNTASRYSFEHDIYAGRMNGMHDHMTPDMGGIAPDVAIMPRIFRPGLINLTWSRIFSQETCQSIVKVNRTHHHLHSEGEDLL